MSDDHDKRFDQLLGLAMGDDRFQEMDSFLVALEQFFADHFRNKGLMVIPRQPPHEVIMAMCEVQRGKRSKQEYMAIVYAQIVAHFRQRG